MNLSSSTDWLYLFVACLLAMLLGVWLAKKQINAFKGHGHGIYPAVTFADYGDMRFLHLGSPAVQGSMKISQPFDIHLEYVQRMMAWLLFADLDRVHELRALQLGLGAASLTKFCYRRLNMHTTALELNPQVIDTCKAWFQLPENNARLQVVQGDAADIAQHQDWQGQIDVLQIDLYDEQAMKPVLDTEAFYRDCHALLTPKGCVVINVFGRASDVLATIQKLSPLYAVWTFPPTPAGNSIVLAFAKNIELNADVLEAQARTIETRWKLPATSWLHLLKPQHSVHS